MSLAKTLLETESAALYEDATHSQALKRIHAAAAFKLKGDFVFSDGSVISVDPWSCVGTATPADFIDKAEVAKQIALASAKTTPAQASPGLMQRIFAPVFSRSPMAAPSARDTVPVEPVREAAPNAPSRMRP